MAIQIPNPGTGNGASGDNEFVLWSKVKDNFSNTTHAASRLVGTGVGNLTLAEDLYKVAFSKDNLTSIPSGGDLDSAMSVGRYSATNLTANLPTAGFWVLDVFDNVSATSSAVSQIAYGRNGNQGVAYRNYTGAVWTPWAIFYTTANTTKEEGTGYLVASSPVLKMQHDSFERVHEAEQLDIEVKNIKTGVYEITGTTGLRKNDGWYFSPPKDEHNNVLCMVEVEEDGDVITVKTYKKKFDFEIVSIVPDYEQPTDIPEGATVMLRFNDLLDDILDDTQTEV